LKPENVLLQASGHIVLTDFDLSYCGRCTPSIEHARHGSDPTLVRNRPEIYVFRRLTRI